MFYLVLNIVDCWAISKVLAFIMKRLKSSYKVFVLASSFFFTVIISLHLFHTYCLQSSILRYKLIKENSVTDGKISKDVKFFLFWTNFFDVQYWGMTKETYFESDLKSIGCLKTNCIFTHNKKHLKNVHDYDSIIFHGAEVWIFLDLPETRNPQQLYVMASME